MYSMNFIYLFVVLAVTYVQAKVNITKFELCNPKENYPVKYAVKLKSGDDFQIVEEGSMINTIDFGDNVLATIDVYIKEKGEYSFLITLNESICNIINKFMGDFAAEMEKSAGLTPGECPIKKGTHKIVNYPLDFKKFKFQNVPQGEMRLKVNMKDAKTNDVVSCLDVEFSFKL